MLERCAKAVRAAAKEIGREGLTDADLRAIDERMDATMRRLAQTEPEWRGLPLDQRVSLAAERIISDIQAEAARNAENKLRQIEVQTRAVSEVQALKAAGVGSENASLRKHYALTHLVSRMLFKDAAGSLMDLIRAAGDKTGAGMGRRFLMTVFQTDNPAMTLDVVREVFKNGEAGTGNEAAKAAARAWLDTIEGLRQRFNAAGGDVRQLDYGYVPQPHDQAKVRKAGADAWARETLPLLDRKRYVNADGSRMSDDAVLDFLRESHKTISTDGLNKSEPGAFQGTGKRANRGSDGREIHFADGDAWAQYMTKFGRGSLYDAMMRHVAGITRDIALVERYGPDANSTARLLQDLAVRGDGTSNSKPVGAFEINPSTYWNMISGKTGAPADESLAQAFSMGRNLMTAAKLGSAILSSFSDLGTLAVTAGYNRLPFWQVLKDIGGAGTKEAKEFMSLHGMVAESAINGLNRWSADNMANNWSGHLSNAVMRASLLNAWTDSLRQGFTLSMNAKLGELSRMPWASLTEFDRVRFQRAGITEADWTALNGVSLEQFNGRELLTPQGIKAAGHQGLAERVFALIEDEAEHAVVNPDLAARAVTTMGGQQAGTWGGEIARTVMQFKAFPITMLTRHWSRMLDGTLDAEGAPMVANRAAYAFAMMATLTGLGAMSFQSKQVLTGKDPINMDITEGTGARFWVKAALTGGGLSIAGDLLLVDPQGSAGDAAATFAKNLAGPMIGSASELLLKDIVENAWQASEGKDTHMGAELLGWAKSNTPGASLWWVKPLLEHGFLNAVNESLSPGYQAKVEARAFKDWGQRYWWKPRDATPQRAPDWDAVTGRN